MSGSIDRLSNDARHADSGETERGKKKIRRIKEKDVSRPAFTTYILRKRKLMQHDYY